MKGELYEVPPDYDVDWHLAQCRGLPLEWFFPTRAMRDADWQRVLSVCSHCPIRKHCQEYGRLEGYGIWGGRLYESHNRWHTAHSELRWYRTIEPALCAECGVEIEVGSKHKYNPKTRDRFCEGCAG